MTPAPDFQARRAALWQTDAARDLDAIVAFGFGDALGAGTLSHGALRYLTGWNGHEAQSLLILTRDHGALVVNSPFLTDIAAETVSGIDIIAAPTADWGALVKHHAPDARRFGSIGFDEMPMAAFHAITHEMGAAGFRAIDETLGRMRLSKDLAEIAALASGAAICDDLFDRLPHALRSGRPVWQIQLDLEYLARTAGAAYCRTWLTVAARADRPRYWPEENRAYPADGDQVLFGIALTWNGYWAHGIRMGVMGAARSHHHTLWQIADQALGVGQTHLTPGTNLTQVEADMSEVILHQAKAAGWPDPGRFRGGHGLGLSYEEPLSSAQFPQHWGPSSFHQIPTSPIAAQASMVLELHPNLFVPGVGGAALGDMFVLDPSGAKPFLQFPRRLFVA